MIFTLILRLSGIRIPLSLRMSGIEFSFCPILLLVVVSSSLLFRARGYQAEHRGGERFERRREDADAAVQQLLVHGAGQEPAAAPAPARSLPRPPLSRHLPAKFIRVRDAWRRGRFFLLECTERRKSEFRLQLRPRLREV
jgi:hypothetical protein